MIKILKKTSSHIPRNAFVTVKQEKLTVPTKKIKKEPSNNITIKTEIKTEEPNSYTFFKPVVVKKEPEVIIIEQPTIPKIESITEHISRISTSNNNRPKPKMQPTQNNARCRTANLLRKSNSRAKQSFFLNRRQHKRIGSSRKQELNTAVHLHRVLSAKNPNQLTRKELDSLTWAESVIVKENLRRLETCHSGVNVNLNEALSGSVINDNLSDTSHPPGNNFISNAEENPDSLQLTVVDFSKPGGRYTEKEAKLIERAFSKAVVDYILTNPDNIPPTFGPTNWYDGVIVLDCKDLHSYQFAKSTISSIHLWNESNLKAMPPLKIPFSSIGRIQVPNLGIEKNNVLNVLKLQNLSINMKKWKILDEEITKHGFKKYTVLITDPPIRLLQNKEIKLFFGVGEVVLKLLGCKWLWLDK